MTHVGIIGAKYSGPHFFARFYTAAIDALARPDTTFHVLDREGIGAAAIRYIQERHPANELLVYSVQSNHTPELRQPALVYPDSGAAYVAWRAASTHEVIQVWPRVDPYLRLDFELASPGRVNALEYVSPEAGRQCERVLSESFVHLPDAAARRIAELIDAAFLAPPVAAAADVPAAADQRKRRFDQLERRIEQADAKRVKVDDDAPFDHVAEWDEGQVSKSVSSVASSVASSATSAKSADIGASSSRSDDDEENDDSFVVGDNESIAVAESAEQSASEVTPHAKAAPAEEQRPKRLTRSGIPFPTADTLVLRQLSPPPRFDQRREPVLAAEYDAFAVCMRRPRSEWPATQFFRKQINLLYSLFCGMVRADLGAMHLTVDELFAISALGRLEVEYDAESAEIGTCGLCRMTERKVPYKFTINTSNIDMHHTWRLFPFFGSAYAGRFVLDAACGRRLMAFNHVFLALNYAKQRWSGSGKTQRENSFGVVKRLLAEAQLLTNQPDESSDSQLDDGEAPVEAAEAKVAEAAETEVAEAAEAEGAEAEVAEAEEAFEEDVKSEVSFVLDNADDDDSSIEVIRFNEHTPRRTKRLAVARCEIPFVIGTNWLRPHLRPPACFKELAARKVDRGAFAAFAMCMDRPRQQWPATEFFRKSMGLLYALFGNIGRATRRKAIDELFSMSSLSRVDVRSLVDEGDRDKCWACQKVEAAMVCTLRISAYDIGSEFKKASYPVLCDEFDKDHYLGAVCGRRLFAFNRVLLVLNYVAQQWASFDAKARENGYANVNALLGAAQLAADQEQDKPRKRK